MPGSEALRVDGDLAHIPDHLALGVEIRRADHEEPTVAVLLCDFGQHAPVHVLGDEIAQRR